MNDLEFVRKCVQADKQAWDEFVDKYSRLIYNYIYSVLRIKGSSCTEEDVRDIFQDLFLRLREDNFRKLKSYKGLNGCSLASWLRQVTINHTIDYLRKLKPTTSLDEEKGEGLDLKDVIPDKTPQARDILNSEEKVGHLIDCINQLQSEDKYFLELHLNQGLSLQELSGHFDISRGAADMRKTRIVQRLRDCFKGKGLWLDF